MSRQAPALGRDIGRGHTSDTGKAAQSAADGASPAFLPSSRDGRGTRTL